MHTKIINLTNNFIKILISQKKLDELQSILFKIDIYVKSEDLISLILLISFLLCLISIITLLFLKISLYFSFIIFLLPSMIIFNYIFYKNEKLKDQIEEELPIYLHQISSLLKVGLGLESALYELTQNSKGSLNNEIKRALTEVRFGKTFNEALLDVARRNNSSNLKHTFEIIIHTRESGANLADILDMIADDLNDVLMLKKERKSSVMMSVMFLLISSVIAIPFCLSMIRLYSEFIEQVGRYNPLITTIHTSSIGYIIIHSVLVSILLAIVLYSNPKKSVKYMVIIIPSSISVYYISQVLFKSILLGGF